MDCIEARVAQTSYDSHLTRHGCSLLNMTLTRLFGHLFDLDSEFLKLAYQICFLYKIGIITRSHLKVISNHFFQIIYSS